MPTGLMASHGGTTGVEPHQNHAATPLPPGSVLNTGVSPGTNFPVTVIYFTLEEEDNNQLEPGAKY